MEFLKQRPAKNPDLPPIDRYCAYLKRKMKWQTFTGQALLLKVIKTEWEARLKSLIVISVCKLQGATHGACIPCSSELKWSMEWRVG
jgi:hypothetical protein